MYSLQVAVFAAILCVVVRFTHFGGNWPLQSAFVLAWQAFAEMHYCIVAFLQIAAPIHNYTVDDNDHPMVQALKKGMCIILELEASTQEAGLESIWANHDAKFSTIFAGFSGCPYLGDRMAK